MTNDVQLFQNEKLTKIAVFFSHCMDQNLKLKSSGGNKQSLKIALRRQIGFRLVIFMTSNHSEPIDGLN